jgi:hypothetical protein
MYPIMGGSDVGEDCDWGCVVVVDVDDADDDDEREG